MITTNRLMRRFALLHGSDIISEAWGTKSILCTPLMRVAHFIYGDGNKVQVEQVDEVLTREGFLNADIEGRSLWCVFAGSDKDGIFDMLVLKGRFTAGTLLDELQQIIEDDEVLSKFAGE